MPYLLVMSMFDMLTEMLILHGYIKTYEDLLIKNDCNYYYFIFYYTNCTKIFTNTNVLLQIEINSSIIVPMEKSNEYLV